MTRFMSSKFAHFWGSVNISQILFWSISYKYLTVSILGLYLFFWFLSYPTRFIFAYLVLKLRVLLFHSDMLKLCMRQKCDIAELFLDTIVFFYEKNLHYEEIVLKDRNQIFNKLD